MVSIYFSIIVIYYLLLSAWYSLWTQLLYLLVIF